MTSPSPKPALPEPTDDERTAYMKWFDNGGSAHSNTWLAWQAGYAHAAACEAAARADETDRICRLIQDFPYWLGQQSKAELIAAIRALGQEQG